MYYGLRFYSPGLGRWRNREPLGDEAFLRRDPLGKSGLARRQLKILSSRERLYNFTSNDPLNQFDILGLIGVCGPRRVPGCPPGVDNACCLCAQPVGANVLVQLARHDIDGGDNAGGGNAFRHCLAACQSVRTCGRQCAQSFWDGRETPGVPADDQDLANNAVGYGVTGSCWEGCMRAWRGGSLNCQGNPCPPP